MISILVTGANGQLGSEIRQLSASHPNKHFIFTDIEELDITNKDKISEFLKQHSFDFIIHCAAYTAVDKAEEEPEKAFLLNGDAVKTLGELCLERNIQLIHLSTDFVFDGQSSQPYQENDKTNPISEYGRSKLAGEKHLAELGSGIIIRTSWLYSSYGHNFVKTILRYGKEKDNLDVVDDQVGNPTYAKDLAETILKIIDKIGVPEGSVVHDVFHYSNEGSCSWYEFASHIIELSGLKCQINPISSDDYQALAKRPAFSILDKSKIKSYLAIEIPHWKDSLGNCVSLFTPDNKYL